MWLTFWQRVGQVVRQLLPLETTILFLFFGINVWPIPFLGPISPLLGLTAIYYWSVYRPDLLRSLSVFCLGLLNDAINGLPPGLSACVYLSIHHLAYTHRRFIVGQTFYMLWFGFGVLTLMAMVIGWVVHSLFVGQMVTMTPVLLQHILTIAIFPLPAWALNRLQHVFLSQG